MFNKFDYIDYANFLEVRNNLTTRNVRLALS